MVGKGGGELRKGKGKRVVRRTSVAHRTTDMEDYISKGQIRDEIGLLVKGLSLLLE